MKNKILMLITVIIMVLSVGCSINVKEENTQNIEETELEVRSNEEMYKIYESYIDEVKSLSKEYGIELEDISNEQNNYNNKTTSLYKYNESKEQYENNEVIGINYTAIIDDKANILQIGAAIDMAVTNEGFKVEDSKFDKFRKIFTDEKIDYTEINEEINESIRDGIDNKIVNQYEDIEEDILIGGGKIFYTIRINP